jgi:hypothetical protein
MIQIVMWMTKTAYSCKGFGGYLDSVGDMGQAPCSYRALVLELGLRVVYVVDMVVDVEGKYLCRMEGIACSSRNGFGVKKKRQKRIVCIWVMLNIESEDDDKKMVLPMMILMKKNKMMMKPAHDKRLQRLFLIQDRPPPGSGKPGISCALDELVVVPVQTETVYRRRCQFFRDGYGYGYPLKNRQWWSSLDLDLSEHLCCWS